MTTNSKNDETTNVGPDSEKTHEKRRDPKTVGTFIQAILFGALVLMLILSVSHRFPLTMDEGVMNARSRDAIRWSTEVVIRLPLIGPIASRFLQGEQEAAETSLSLFLSDWGTTSYWTGTTNEEGHPEFPVILHAFGKTVAPSFLPEPTRLRFGMILFFSLAMGAAFFRLKTDFDGTTAVLALASILLIPRVFAHSQIAFWDSPLMSSWILAWAFFPYAVRNDFGAILFGIVSGLAFASKFPGWALFLPMGVWLICRLLADRFEKSTEKNRFDVPLKVLVKRAFFAIFFSLVVFILFCPPLWPDPVTGFRKFVFLNTHRPYLIPTLFLGEVYDLKHSLPWWNTIFWTVVTVPIGLFALGFLGIVTIFRNEKRRWAGLLVLLNFLTLVIIRACPGTPPHEGVRLFIAAFPFFGVLAGIGAAALWKWTPWTWMPRRWKAGKGIVVAVFVACFFNMFWYAPQWLCYYSLPIGGLPGAVRAGMETTYYWDGFDGEVIDWLNTHTEPGEKILLSHATLNTFTLYNKWGMLVPRCEVVLSHPDTLEDLRKERQGCRLYVFQHRQGWQPSRDLQLMMGEKPVFVKTIRKGGWGPWNLGSVPIVEIYDLVPEKKNPAQTDGGR